MPDSIELIRRRRGLAVTEANARYHSDMLHYHRRRRSETRGLPYWGHSLAAVYHSYVGTIERGVASMLRSEIRSETEAGA